MRLRSFRALALLLIVGTGRVVFTQSPSPPAPPPPAPSAVTFTDEQATRGGAVFSRVCVACHARKELSNADFRVKWNGRSAFDLFERIRSTMPESEPGSLERAEYIDVTAYIAKLNTLSPGTVEMPDDEAVLKKQTLVLK